MRDVKDLTILILPGLGGSGPEHWQTAWEKAFPGFQRVKQASWDQPVYGGWRIRLTEAVGQSTRPVVPVAHSLGTSLAMRWAFDEPVPARKVAGAFLVAPTDRDRMEGAPGSRTLGFGRMILERLPFPSAVVAPAATTTVYRSSAPQPSPKPGVLR